MQFPLCRHTKTNGRRCKSPALKARSYCYFHQRTHQRHNPASSRPLPGPHVDLTALEDRESIQAALSVVVNALATGNLETERATALLYGIQLASSNTSSPAPTLTN
jgi:hypothetical protein